MAIISNFFFRHVLPYITPPVDYPVDSSVTFSSTVQAYTTTQAAGSGPQFCRFNFGVAGGNSRKECLVDRVQLVEMKEWMR
jgi:hypothetical protein